MTQICQNTKIYIYKENTNYYQQTNIQGALVANKRKEKFIGLHFVRLGSKKHKF